MALTTIYLILPNVSCGKLTCYLVQLSVLMPSWEGSFFVCQIALLRNLLVRAESIQNQSCIEKRHRRIFLTITLVSFSYLSIIQFIYGPDGVVFHVSKLFLSVQPSSQMLNFKIFPIVSFFC